MAHFFTSIGGRRPVRQSGPRAFTLVEILVVVTIILLLMAMLTPALTKFRATFQRSRSISVINIIDTAVRLYQADFATPIYDPAIRGYKNDPNAYPPSNATGLGVGDGFHGKELLYLFLTGYRDDDGCTGFGFRVIPRGKVYGPYNDTNLLPVPKPADRTPPNGPPYFMDYLDNPIYYYRRNSSGTFDSSDNPGGPGDMDAYTAGCARDFLLITPGHNQTWADVVAADDDISNIAN